MKFKTLKLIQTDEFAMIEAFGDPPTLVLFTGNVPHLHPMTATKKGLINYYNTTFPNHGIDFRRLKMVIVNLEEQKK